MNDLPCCGASGVLSGVDFSLSRIVFPHDTGAPLEVAHRLARLPRRRRAVVAVGSRVAAIARDSSEKTQRKHVVRIELEQDSLDRRVFGRVRRTSTTPAAACSSIRARSSTGSFTDCSA